jgi:tetratricopeptide (TPR) repeat protein
MSTQTRETPSEVEVSTNPFPGLRPFEFDESHLFFGRDGQSEQLIGKLSRTRFLAVVGTSGSGKSSLVRAGFLPALLGGFMTTAGSAWRVAIMRPGNDPVGNLARALNSTEVFGSDDEENAAIQTAIAESTLRRGSLGLVDAVRQAVMAPDENLLVVVDQFEEIFRFARVATGEQYGNEAAAFIKLLLEASSQRDVPIYVVLTMRSDYLGDCSQFWGLPEAINESQYLIPRLTRDRLREAITGPVAVGGGKITPRLVNRLLNDVGDNQDQLPVLQHLLMRSWNEWKEKLLTIDTKIGEETISRRHKDVHEGDAIDLCCADAVGGMAQALSRHADEAFSELPTDHHREVAEKLFKALTEKGPDNREIRRPITLGEICAVTGAGKREVATVIETFRRPGRSFLMPPPTVALESESLIDISHESLIRGWARLKEWVDEEARSSRIYRRLAETAVLHKEGGAGLWRDPDLQIALNWREQGKPNEVWARRYHPEFALAGNFLDKSVEARDAQVAADEARRRKEIKRSRLTALVFFVAFLFSGVMGAYAFTLKNRADVAKNEALDERIRADKLKDEALARNAALDEALTRTKLADAAKAEALEQKKIADKAKDAALADALARKKEAESAKNEALAQKAVALKNLELAKAETLKGQALGALKELKLDEAIKFFNELREFHNSRKSAEGESYAIAGIADIYRDRVPLALLIDETEGSSPLDIEEKEAKAAAQYCKMLQLVAYAGDNDEQAFAQFSKDTGEALRYYQDALTANQRNSQPARPAQDARILQNMGDLSIALAKIKEESKRETKDESETPDKEMKAREIETQVAVGIKHYQDASDLYKKAELYSEQGNVLMRIADVFASRLEKKSELKSKEPEYGGPAQVDPNLELNRVVNYYSLASAAFGLAKEPLLEAVAQSRIGYVYESVSTDEQNRLHDSVKYFKAARDLYRNKKSHRGEAIFSEKLAALYNKLSDEGNELASYKEAYQAYRLASLEPKAKSSAAVKAEEMFKKAGNLLIKSEGNAEANAFFEAAISRSADAESKAQTLGTVAEFYVTQKNTAEAVKYYRRKLDTWRAVGNPNEEGNTLFRLGSILDQATDIPGATASYDAARKAYSQVDVLKEKPGDKSARTANLGTIALFYSKHDKEKQVATYEEALQSELRGTNFYEILRLLQLEGDVLLEGKTEQANARARQLFQRVLDFVVRNEKNPDGEANALTAIADLYKKHGEKAEALAYYERARASYLARKNIYSLTGLLKKVAELEVAESSGQSAVDYYLRVAESAAQSRDLLTQGAALEVAGDFYRQANEKQKALDHYERARIAYQQSGQKNNQSSVMRAMGYLYRDLGNISKGDELLKQAEEIMRAPSAPR